ncbi:hypothetical protein CC1G_11499 [Coprinopsis cinerea okayama7|uniref:Uncharacterized protein n=1 Tax=Coprinopsis cinerea (strain Okayama-7 / 130 / ATCC MYA-4618 / FGSC 9003) TaxID=240176 RepID=A8NH95_COPC7|nr:hypothetical protein CC1G_11499 [Coprinopsis cinerea okayama7\|eukprot:XP_001833714.2 hypothetical protein CC1G_11499 [Coprinopsis cinerea okayama7\
MASRHAPGNTRPIQKSRTIPQPSGLNFTALQTQRSTNRAVYKHVEPRKKFFVESFSLERQRLLSRQGRQASAKLIDGAKSPALGRRRGPGPNNPTHTQRRTHGSIAPPQLRVADDDQRCAREGSACTARGAGKTDPAIVRLAPVVQGHFVEISGPRRGTTSSSVLPERRTSSRLQQFASSPTRSVLKLTKVGVMELLSLTHP